MPWQVKQINEEWCVTKEGEETPIPGGCHGKNKSKATKHMKALYASEAKEVEETEDKDWSDRWVPSGIFTFKDLDAARDGMKKADEVQSLTTSLRYLIDNVIYSPDVTNKSKALVTLVDEFSNRIDGVDTKELTILTKEQLDSAAAGELDPKAKREVRQGYEALGVSDKEIPQAVKGLDDEVFVWKEENGSCKVAFIYSNNYRDDDGFPEIIEEKAHKAFTELVNSDVLPKPEMWHWHVEGTRWGQIDHMLYHDGFSVAFGTVDPGKENDAQTLATKEEVGVSHGMIKRFMVRDEKDPSHIQFYVSKEISDLPMPKAANKLTGLTVFEGDDDMEIKGLTDQKREYLKTNFGYTDSQLDTIETNLIAKKEQAEAQGRESKEEKSEVKVEVTVPPVLETPAPEAGEFSVKEITQTIYKEIAEGLGEVMKPLIDANMALGIQVKALTEEVNSMKAGAAKKTLEESPSLSFKELMAASVFGPSAQINGNSSLAKDKPQETQDKAATAVTGIATIDAALQATQQYQSVRQ